jgi:hypothetical protein
MLLVDNGKSEKISFVFDSILSPSASQDEVYNFVSPLIRDAIGGYNGTIMTYGQTGSGRFLSPFPSPLIILSLGKTYTMNGSDSDQGIIPRAVQTVFELISISLKYKTTVSISCLEIYQEKLCDLLNDTPLTFPNTEVPLRIRQTSLGSVWVEVLISSSPHFFIITPRA